MVGTVPTTSPVAGLCDFRVAVFSEVSGTAVFGAIGKV
jgi:hypothetical protein